MGGETQKATFTFKPHQIFHIHFLPNLDVTVSLYGEPHLKYGYD
jgi:hypothetical protein